MHIATLILTIIGLALFETISSIDNAIINAEVLHTMGPKSRKWFLTWGILIAIFVIRGLLPWFIIWVTVPSLGLIGALVATFSSNQSVIDSIKNSAPLLLGVGGMFLVLLFLHWLFLEQKNFGLIHEPFFQRNGGWFYASASLVLVIISWFALNQNPMLAFSVIIGSTAFFITHGFKTYAEQAENDLKTDNRSEWSKLLYLEIIDATFSIDSVLGAFAFTLSIPLIIIGNGIGAIMVRQMTIGNIDTIKKYMFLKNGAMYSILILGVIMMINAFGFPIPEWISPVATFLIVGYFFLKSRTIRKRT